MISFAILLPTVTDQPAASLVGMTSHNIAGTLGRSEQTQTNINDKTKFFLIQCQTARRCPGLDLEPLDSLEPLEPLEHACRRP